MVLTSHHSVLFLRLEYPQLQLPGTESFPSSTKACPIYLRSVSGIFPLCIPTLLLLLDFDYPRQNHFNSFLTGFLVSPHPQHRPTNVTPLTKPTKHSLYPLHVNLWSSPRQLEYSLNYFHSWETASCPTFCLFNTCVPIIPSQANCCSSNTPWLSNALVYFAHSVPLSWISLYPNLYLLNCSQACKTQLKCLL